MIVLNFSHSLNPAQLESVERLSGRTVDRVIDVPTHFDVDRDFVLQASELMSGSILTEALTPNDFQSLPILVVPPSFSAIAGLILAELHGRMGYFPPILRLKPVAEPVGTRFEPAEIINLDAVRQRAREKR